MTLEIRRLRDQQDAHEGAYLIVDRRLWLTADGLRVVEDGDPEAAVLFATPGDKLSAELAAKYGLGAKARARPEDKARAKPEDK